MIIEKSVFALYYPAQNSIRERIFDLEKYHNGFQKPFTLIPVPENAPLEIPRIVTNTDNGHSRLTYTGLSVQLETNFDNDFSGNADLCLEYVEKKCTDIVDSLQVISRQTDQEPSFYYAGLMFTLSYGKEDGIENAITYLRDRFINLKTGCPIEEIQFRVALNKKDAFFVNLSLQSVRVYHGQTDERGSFAGLPYDDRLQIILDINDKLAFNQRERYSSNKGSVQSIIRLAREVLNSDIDRFVRGGVIDDDSN